MITGNTGFKKRLQLATLLKRFGHHEAATKRYEQLVLEHPSPYIQIDLAELYLLQGTAQKGLDLLNSALKKKPNNPRLLKQMGMIHYQLEHYDDAKKYLTRSLTIEETPEILRMLALLANRQNNTEKSIEYYQKLIETYHQDNYLLNLAILQERSEHLEAAEKSYQAYFESTQNARYAMRYLIRFYKRYNRLDDIATLKKAFPPEGKRKRMRPLLKSRR